MGEGAARPSGCLPRLVLGDGGVDFRLLDLVGRGAVPEGCEHAVLIQGDDHGYLAAEVDHVVTAAVILWPCTHKSDASPDALRGPVLTRLCGTRSATFLRASCTRVPVPDPRRGPLRPVPRMGRLAPGIWKIGAWRKNRRRF